MPSAIRTAFDAPLLNINVVIALLGPRQVTDAYLPVA